MNDWLDAVVDGRDHNVVRRGVAHQRWVLVSCVCDSGPWRVYVSAGDVFHCAVCGAEMRQEDDDDG